jgi:hypothetical protein
MRNFSERRILSGGVIFYRTLSIGVLSITDHDTGFRLFKKRRLNDESGLLLLRGGILKHCISGVTIRALTLKI